LEDFADTPIDVMITGVGTGGHITGCAEVLKKAWPNLKVFAVEPTLSPVISGGQPGPHAIQGIGAGFIPANLHTALLDGVIQVDPENAKETARRAALKKVCWLAFHQARHWQQLRRNCPNCPPEAAYSVSIMTQVNDIYRFRISYRSNKPKMPGHISRHFVF
jgi:cysteine synthase A